jgi:hypothetical protein
MNKRVINTSNTDLPIDIYGEQYTLEAQSEEVYDFSTAMHFKKIFPDLVEVIDIDEDNDDEINLEEMQDDEQSESPRRRVRK